MLLYTEIPLLGGHLDLARSRLQGHVVEFESNMAKPRVYIETTIPSFYYNCRSEPEMVARGRWTREWWDDANERYDRLTSEAVLDELSDGEYESQEAFLALLSNLPLLVIGPEVIEIAATYIQHRLMPNDPTGDELHLAVASYHQSEFSLTWNCQHLANANKFGHIRRVNTMLGLYVPTLVTPLELLGAKNE